MIDLQNMSDVPSAEELRAERLRAQVEEIEKREKLRKAEQSKRAEFADHFLHDKVSDEERAMIRRVVNMAVEHRETEALVYSFPSSLCTDDGRAINNNLENWPDTLQGKARELFDRYEEMVKPKGYRLKAMIINFPGGKPGDVGIFLSWA